MAGHSKWANIRHRKGVQGEAGLSRIHLTCIRAAERPTMGETEISRKPCGLSRRRTAMPWMAWPGLASEAGRKAQQGRAGVTRSISRCAMDGMHDSRLCGERQISEWERA